LVAFLALQNRPLPRSHVASVLWTDVSESRAAGNLRTALWRLQALRLTVVDVKWDSLNLTPGVFVDVSETISLARSIVEGRSAITDLPDSRWFEGDLLPGWYDEWVLSERERYHQLCLLALETLSGRLLDAGHVGNAILCALTAISRDPLRESAYRALIAAYIAQGNACEALRQYQRYSKLVNREMGIGPTPLLTQLIEQFAVR
jgi:DNA-binding SARP family transcriptional activator